MKNVKRVIKAMAAVVAAILVVFLVGEKTNAATFDWFDYYGGNNQETQTEEVHHNPVVFVHGMYSTSIVFSPLESYLASQGWNSSEMVSVDLPDKISYGPVDCAVISNAVDELLRKTGAEKVDIVAHSMGGANSLYYIMYGGGANKVDKLVTLGGANGLVTNRAPSGIDVTTISSTADFIVNPMLSRLSGANNITISMVSHVGLLTSREVEAEVVKALSAE